MLEYKRREEQRRIGSDLAQKPFADFLFFKTLESDAKLHKTFTEMQKIYVFNDIDIISFSEVIKHMSRLNLILHDYDRYVNFYNHINNRRL